MEKREANIIRTTKETQIELNLNLDGNGNESIKTEIGFFNHMLELFAFHSNLDLYLNTKGDVWVDDHHLIEDIGIALGIVFKEALGDKKGIKRYSTIFLPMDETLVMISLDISGRPYLHFEGEFNREKVGEFSTEMVEEFLRAFAFNAGITLHVRIMYGSNDHHKIEAIFKGLGRALKEAIIVEGDKLPSTKGSL